jgi:hypothetical protein
MSARVRVRHHGDQLAAVKLAVAPGDDLLLVREAAMLTAARHPGVVPLVGLGRTEGHLELLTAWVGTRSLLDARPLPPVQAAGVVRALATTVADLHRHGVVHGAIEASHVLLDSQGRPVLCSFGRAAFVGTTEVGPTRPSDDVAALGELLIDLVGDADDPELVPSRRFGRRREHHLHRGILTLADHARAHDATTRPSAAALASALADLVPDAALPSELGQQLERLRASAATVEPRPRRGRVVGATLLVGALSVLAFGTVAFGTVVTSAPAAPDPVPVAVTTAPSATNAPSSTDAPMVDLAGHRYEIGRPGDRAHVGHWRCDTDQQVILVRPTTGELFLFDDAPPGGEQRTVTAFAKVLGATDARPVGVDDSCPTLMVERADGQVTPLALPGRR